MSQHSVTLLLGSNLGNTEENIEMALNRIQNEIGDIIGRSIILHTEAVEFVSNNIFCNIAVLIKTQFSPINLLNIIKSIEIDMGRKEDSFETNAYVDRIIDVDIVHYDDITFECSRLQIPHHKHLYQREFSKKLLLNIKTH